LSLALPARGH